MTVLPPPDEPDDLGNLGDLIEQARRLAERLWPLGSWVVSFDDDPEAPEVPTDPASTNGSTAPASWELEELNPSLRDPSWVRPWLAVALPCLLAMSLAGTFMLMISDRLAPAEAAWFLGPLLLAILWMTSYFFRRGR